MALINKAKYYKDFTVLPNAIFEDKDMSLKATGLLAYALSKPPEWKIKTQDIVSRFSDGRDSVYSAIKELEELGYMIKVQDQENNGKFTEVVYEVYDTPRKTKPLPAKPFTENPQHSNTDISNTEEIPKGISNRTPPFKRNGLLGGGTKDIVRGPSVLTDASFKEELCSLFGLSTSAVQWQLDSMIDWLASTGRVYKDYRAFARGWLRKGLAKGVPLEKKEGVNYLN